MSQQAATPATAQPSRRRRIVSWLVRLGITSAALAWAMSQTDFDALGSALARVSGTAAVLSVAIFLVNLLVGAARWRVLLVAYGGKWKPPLLLLWRVYLVALFYNTVLPANVGGDVMRGYVTRRAFPGAAGAYLVVAIERIFGLAGIFLLAAIGLIVHPIPEISNMTVFALAGIVVAGLAAASPMAGRRLAPWLPGRLRTMAELLPTVRVPALLIVVLALSVGTQTALALTGHVLLSSIDPQISLGTSIILVPVAMAAIYAPTVGGLGAREAAFVLVFGAIGMGETDAVAASFAMFAAQLATALLGGLAHLIAPLPDPEEETTPGSEHVTPHPSEPKASTAPSEARRRGESEGAPSGRGGGVGGSM
ncbi:MAG: lysylphosphatidylglycerol synthase transmembrane domain-containing protein [Myxococcota bacterium]